MLRRRKWRTILMGIYQMVSNIGTVVCGSTYGGVGGRKTKVGRKLLRFPPTRLKRIGKRIRDASRYAYKLFVSFVAVWANPTITHYWFISFSVAIIARIAERTISSTLLFCLVRCSIPAFSVAALTFFLADFDIAFYKFCLTVWTILFLLLEGLCLHRF